MRCLPGIRRRFVCISAVGTVVLAALAFSLSLPSTVCGDEAADKAKAAAKKAAEEAQRMQQEAMAAYEAELRAAEKQRQEDPAWQPTHEQSGVIRVQTDAKSDFIRSLCLNADGEVLVGCGGKQQTAEVKDGKVTVKTTSTPSELRFYTPDGKLIRTWKVETEPQAICARPDGTVFVAGDGKLLRIDSDGHVVARAAMPSVAEDEKPAAKSGKEKPAAKAKKEKPAKTDKAAKPKADKPAKTEKPKQEDADKAKKKAEDAQAAREKAIAEVRKRICRAATGLAATDNELFVVSLGSKDFRYSVWRMDHDFKQPKEIITGLIGCCGQMDIQAVRGEIWIPENGRHRVTRYDREGKQLSSFGKRDRKAADGFGGCCEPKNLCFGPDGDVYTAESGEPVVVKQFSRDGKFKNVVAIPKYKTGCVHVCVAAGQDGRVYILNPGESAIHVFTDKRKTPSHRFVRSFGVTGGEKTPVQLNSFCLAADGNVLAACGQGDKGAVRVVDPEGKLLATWKLDFVPQAINRAADGTICVGGSGKMARLDAAGKVLKQVDLPSETKPLPPEELKKLQEELKKLQADNAKLFAEYRDLQMRSIKLRQESREAELDLDNAMTDKEKAEAKALIEKLKGEQKKAQELVQAKIPEVSKASQAMQKLSVKIGASGRRGTVTGIAGTKRDLFVCRTPDAGYGYEVWRTDPDFGNAKKIITGLAGCCGQMDIQADGDELWIPENARHQVHRYDREGKKLSSFGKNDRSAPDGFGGCCEPKNVRIVGDGIYTAESTQPVQIKHFGKDGRFRGIVAVPSYKTGCVRVCVEVSADKNQIFCLSPGENAIYLFEKGAPAAAAAKNVKAPAKEEKCKEEKK